MGNLVAEPEMKITGSGIKVCSFRIACERDYSANGARKETDYVDVVAWREKAEFVSRYFSKGMPILVSGRLQIRKWEDREGNKRNTVEIQAEDLYFAGGEKKQKTDEPHSSDKKSAKGAYDGIVDEFDDELPF